MGVDVSETKVMMGGDMMGGERIRQVQSVVGWPCGVCGGGVGSN